jgi:tetratricopeptide (TPR) repeat protein
MRDELLTVLDFAANYASEQSRMEEAEEHLLESLRLLKGSSADSDQLTVARARLGEWYLSTLHHHYLSQGKENERLDACRQASVIFEELTKLDHPQRWLYWLRLAEAQRRLGQFDAALQSATRSIALNSHAPETWHVRGLAHNGLKQHAKAIDDFSRALALQPKSEWTWFGRGESLLQNGQVEQALGDFRQAIAIAPDRAGFHETL